MGSELWPPPCCGLEMKLSVKLGSWAAPGLACPVYTYSWQSWGATDTSMGRRREDSLKLLKQPPEIQKG